VGVSEDCIFCRIVAGELPAQVVAHDEHSVAFMDINPWRPGHALVVPRRHARDLLEIDDEDLAHVFRAAHSLAARMRERLDVDHVVLYNACGAAAGQVVPHFHIHVIPGGPEDEDVPPRPAEPVDRADIERAAAALRG